MNSDVKELFKVWGKLAGQLFVLVGLIGFLVMMVTGLI